MATHFVARFDSRTYIRPPHSASGPEVKRSHFVSKRIYVGSLPYSTTEDQLEEMFGAFGKVTDAQVITDRFTGQAKGFAFVEMEDDDEALQAINALNGSAQGGRTLVVNEAREREQRTGGGGGGRFGGGGGAGGGGGRFGGGGGGNRGGGNRRW